MRRPERFEPLQRTLRGHQWAIGADPRGARLGGVRQPVQDPQVVRVSQHGAQLALGLGMSEQLCRRHIDAERQFAVAAVASVAVELPRVGAHGQHQRGLKQGTGNGGVVHRAAGEEDVDQVAGP